MPWISDLANFKVPRRFIVMDDFPRSNAVNRVQKAKLREMAEQVKEREAEAAKQAALTKQREADMRKQAEAALREVHEETGIAGDPAAGLPVGPSHPRGGPRAGAPRRHRRPP